VTQPAEDVSLMPERETEPSSELPDTAVVSSSELRGPTASVQAAMSPVTDEGSTVKDAEKSKAPKTKLRLVCYYKSEANGY